MYDISHNNLLLYSGAIPSTDVGNKSGEQQDEPEWGGELDYDNPDNFKDLPDEPQRI